MDRRRAAALRAGLLAALLLALGGYAAGALPAGDPGAGLVQRGIGAMSAPFRLGVLGCLGALVGWLLAWQRLGRAPVGRPDGQPDPGCADQPGASQASGWSVSGWPVLAILVWAAAMLLSPPLGSRDVYSYACQGWLHAVGADPYLVGPASGGCPWADNVASLWQDTVTPYGPFALALSAAAARPALGSWADPPTRLLLVVTLLRLIALAGVLLTAWGAARLAGSCGVPPARAVWLAAASPLVIVHAVAGAHNDAVLTGLILAALVTAIRAGPGGPEPRGPVRASGPTGAPEPIGASGPAGSARSAGSSGTCARPGGQLLRGGRVSPGSRAFGLATAAGALLGLAAAVKITAIVALPFVGLLAVGAARRWWWPAVGVVAGTAGSFLAMTGWTGLGFGWVRAFGDTASSVQWTSVPTAVGMSVGYLLRALGYPAAMPDAVAAARVVGLVVLLVAGLAAVVRAVRRRGQVPTVVACCGAALAGSVLLAPVAYPWYALAPLAVLAAVLTTDRGVRWLVGASWVLTLLVLPNGLGVAVLTKGPGAVLVAAGALAVVVVRVVGRRPATPHPTPVSAVSGQSSSSTTPTPGRLSNR